jgi:hypothetical protein
VDIEWAQESLSGPHTSSKINYHNKAQVALMPQLSSQADDIAELWIAGLGIQWITNGCARCNALSSTIPDV